MPEPSGPPVPEQGPPDAAAAGAQAAAWEVIASGDGTALRLMADDGTQRLTIACLGSPKRLVVNAPDFEPVMSEDRFAFGVGEEPVTLVANPYQQDVRPGVTGEGPVPGDFAELLEGAGDVRALYGSQQAGPYPAPPAALKEQLVKACL